MPGEPDSSGTIYPFHDLDKVLPMNIQTSQAIIMRIKEFGESDLLVTFFTPDKGLVKGVAKGARRSRKRFVNCLDHFCLVNLEYGTQKKGDLHFLHSGKLIKAHEGLRNDYTVLSRASYMIELTEVLFPLGVADPRMFGLLTRSFEALAAGEDTETVTMIFEARALALGGYAFNFEKCCKCQREYRGEGTAVFIPEKGGISCLNCQPVSFRNPKLTPEAVKTIQKIQSEPLDQPFGPALSDQVLNDLKPVFKLHREYHLGLRMKSLNLFEE
jgi:DNA repair protein RecO (recombination protein O)